MRSLLQVSILLLFVCSCSNENSGLVSYSGYSLEEGKPEKKISETAGVSKNQSASKKELQSPVSKSEEAISKESSKREKSTIKEEDKKQFSDS